MVLHKSLNGFAILAILLAGLAPKALAYEGGSLKNHGHTSAAGDGGTLSNLNVSGTFNVTSGSVTFSTVAVTGLSTVSSITVNGSFTVTTGSVTISSSTLQGGTTMQGTLSFQPTTLGIVGTTTNDAATTGLVGEQVETFVTANTNFPTSTQWGDLGSISIGPGDWNITALTDNLRNGATWGDVNVGISSTTGNSSAGLFVGDTRWDQSGTFGTVIDEFDGVVPPRRFSIPSTTTFYIKYMANYSVATPTARGRLTARRIR